MKHLHHSINSERLTIDPLHPSDAAFILTLLNTEGWIQFIGDRNVHSLKDAEAYIQKIISNPDILYWVVNVKSEQISVGIITLLKRKDLPHPDLGFAFLPSYMNKGYAYESCRSVLEHCLGSGEISFLNAITNEKNTSSIKLLKKIGFTFTSEQQINSDIVQVYSASIDKIQISLIIHDFFSAFSNSGEHQPCLHVVRDVCLREALIISQQPTRTDIMNVGPFLSPREKILTDGTLQGFWEKEIHEETTIIKEMAQRRSQYKKRGILRGNPFETIGNKFFQLVKLEGSWKISSVIWTDD